MADFEKANFIDKEPSSEQFRVSVREDEESVGGGGERNSSGNHQTAAAAAGGVPLVSDEWIGSIMKEGEESLASENSTTLLPKHNKIQKVPHTLRRQHLESSMSNMKCYDPEVVSVGPYHHGKTELQSFEKLKIRFTRDYCENVSQATLLYNEVAWVAGKARKYYAEESTQDLDDRAFTQMMFLDGCFILQFICCFLSRTSGKQSSREYLLKINQLDIELVQRDLYLIENQLPFEVLQAMMSMGSKFHGDHCLNLINDFITYTRLGIYDDPFLVPRGENFIKRCIKWIRFPNLDNSIPVFLTPRRKRRPTTEHKNEPVLHLLELKWRQLIDSSAYGSCCCNSRWFPRRSATDLQMVGIHFRPSQTDCLTNITFKCKMTYGGLLTLPPINIDDATMFMLLNLVAYETSLENSPACILGVTNYICFLDSMIASANDVKELKYAGIIANFLRNDEEAVEVIHEIAAGLVPDGRCSTYFEVKWRIEEYHRHRGRTRVASWISEVTRVYFRSPWTAIAVIAAGFAICLSIVETYFTIFPP